MSTLRDSFSAKWSNVTAWRCRGCPIIKHPWTWGSNEVFVAEKTRVASAILIGRKCPLRQRPRNAGLTQVSSAASITKSLKLIKASYGIFTCLTKTIEFFRANSLEWLKMKHLDSEISFTVRASLPGLLYPAKSRIPRARSRERSAVSEMPAKRPLR